MKTNYSFLTDYEVDDVLKAKIVRFVNNPKRKERIPHAIKAQLLGGAKYVPPHMRQPVSLSATDEGQIFVLDQTIFPNPSRYMKLCDDNVYEKENNTIIKNITNNLNKAKQTLGKLNDQTVANDKLELHHRVNTLKKELTQHNKFKEESRIISERMSPFIRGNQDMLQSLLFPFVGDVLRNPFVDDVMRNRVDCFVTHFSDHLPVVTKTIVSQNLGGPLQTLIVETFKISTDPKLKQKLTQGMSHFYPGGLQDRLMDVKVHIEIEKIVIYAKQGVKFFHYNECTDLLYIKFKNNISRMSVKNKYINISSFCPQDLLGFRRGTESVQGENQFYELQNTGWKTGFFSIVIHDTKLDLELVPVALKCRVPTWSDKLKDDYPVEDWPNLPGVITCRGCMLLKKDDMSGGFSAIEDIFHFNVHIEKDHKELPSLNGNAEALFKNWRLGEYPEDRKLDDPMGARYCPAEQRAELFTELSNIYAGRLQDSINDTSSRLNLTDKMSLSDNKFFPRVVSGDFNATSPIVEKMLNVGTDARTGTNGSIDHVYTLRL